MTRFVAGVLIAILSCTFIDVNKASSQQTLASSSATQTKTRAIVASFNKSKHVVKEKYGVRREKYKEVRSEAAIKANPQSYSGTYEVPDLGFVLHLRVDKNGHVEAIGEEPVGGGAGVMRRFTLRNAKVKGALLTGTKVYATGSSEQFEGAFIDRTSFDSPTAEGVTKFGLGVVGRAMEVSGVTLDKFFFELRR